MAQYSDGALPYICSTRREGPPYNMFGDPHQTERIDLAKLASKEMDATSLLALLTELNRMPEYREHEAQKRRTGNTPND